ncbi:MAG: cupin-like domain-containing protein [Crocinitomicaceae bacterium]
MNTVLIERCNDIDYHTFKNIYLKQSKPLIFRSFSEDWPAIEKWNYSFFRSNYGNIDLPISGDWSKKNATQIDRGVDYSMKFEDFLTEIENGPTDYRLFAFNLIKLKPELEKDFKYPPFAARWIKIPYLFFGGEGSNVRLHYDIDHSDVFLTQFFGRKKITLFSPAYSNLLYRQPFTTHSHLDLASIEFSKDPVFPFLTCLIGEIEEGDTLYIPARYWHFIEYETSGFSMALRSLNSSNFEVLKGGVNVLLNTSLDGLLGKLVPKLWENYKLKKAKSQTERAIESLENRI